MLSNSKQRFKDKYKYKPPDPRRSYRILSSEELTAGKFSKWSELKIESNVRILSPKIFDMRFLTALYLNDNKLTILPSEINLLDNLTYLDISNNNLRSLPTSIGDLVSLREFNISNNNLRRLPNEVGKLFLLQHLRLQGNPLPPEILSIYTDGTSKLLLYLLDNLEG